MTATEWCQPGAFVICIVDGWQYPNGQVVIGPAPKNGKVYTVGGVGWQAGFIVLAEIPHEMWPTDAFAPVPPYEMLQFRRLLTGKAPITENETFIKGRIT